LHEPQILFLDEPTAGVDPVARRSFWKVIRQLAAAGHTLFVTTHHLDEAEYCDRVGFMVDGRLVALDTPAELKRAHVPGVIHEVSGTLSARELSAALASEEQVLGVRTFGASAHVRVTGALGNADNFMALLAERGFAQVELGPAEATLEDVFLELASPGHGQTAGSAPSSAAAAPDGGS
jgi:ABC-2 type transport system ATP-binding protein